MLAMINSAASIGSCSCVSTFGSLSMTPLRQVALFEIEHAVIAKQKPALRFFVSWFLLRCLPSGRSSRRR